MYSCEILPADETIDPEAVRAEIDAIIADFIAAERARDVEESVGKCMTLQQKKSLAVSEAL